MARDHPRKNYTPHVVMRMVGTGNRGAMVVELNRLNTRNSCWNKVENMRGENNTGSKEQASKNTRNNCWKDCTTHVMVGEEIKVSMAENMLELPSLYARNHSKNSWNCQAPLPTT